ncbi:MAG: DNA repair exonuclease [Chloroflexi bacterium CG_4_8_14_3_um_filter_45_15]|nr:MAG: DNA repair exonuclease [Chloroflexi bacterium CG_4_8_14_3_um_filter_45_15]
MKILHTADIHLREYNDERWEALQKLIEVGKGNKIDIFIICGDLFDKDVDAENLRPQIRETFSNTGFKVLIIPGNHDKDSYKSGMYFGEDVFILGNSPSEYGDMRIVGVPFEPIQGEEFLKKIQALKEILRPDKKNILLCHGELLDAFFSRMDFGKEGEARYMPFKLSYFDKLNIDYVLAGHFHSKFDIRQLKNGGYFVYPGSPVSVTKSEIGQRSINIFELGEPPREYLVDTFHFEEVTVELDPFKDENPLEILRHRFETLHTRAKVILTLSGYINSEKSRISEVELVAQAREMTKGKCVEEHYEFRDISRILEDPLFKGFVNKVTEANYTKEEAGRLQNICIKAMTQARL